MASNNLYTDFYYHSRKRFFTVFLAASTGLLSLGLIFVLTTGFFQSVEQKTDPGQSQAAFLDDPDVTRTPTPYRKLKTSKTAIVYRDVAGATVAPGTIKIGDRAYYTVSMKNIGNVSLNSVQVSDAIPAGTKYRPGTATISNGTTLTVGNPIVATKDVLPPGQTFKLSFEAFFAYPTPGQTVVINKGVVTTSSIDPADPVVKLTIQ